MKLHELQMTMQNAILSSEHDEFLSVVKANGASEKRSRFDIYSSAYLIRLMDVLRADFKVTCFYLGESETTEILSDYLSKNISTHFSIRYLGQYFSEYILRKRELNNAKCYADLARFEWALIHAIDAQDGSPITLKYLQNLSPEQWPDLTVCRHTSVTLKQTTTDVIQFYSAFCQGDEAQSIIQSRKNDTNYWLIWRYDQAIQYRACDEAEYVALLILEQACSIGEFAARIEEDNSTKGIVTDPQQLAVWIQQWAQEGLLISPE